MLLFPKLFQWLILQNHRHTYPVLNYLLLGYQQRTLNTEVVQWHFPVGRLQNNSANSFNNSGDISTEPETFFSLMLHNGHKGKIGFHSKAVLKVL